MKVLTVGGGSGGHVTPVVAVIHELKRRQADVSVRFWCDRSFAEQATSIMHHAHPDVSVRAIFSGKFRRYHSVSMMKQLLDVPTLLRNIRDVVLVSVGFIQSMASLLVWRPDVVFTKGGYVCLPVGLAAKLLKIPLVIHDSDAHPGLTNRILSRWASRILTGAPLEYYDYPSARSRYVGIPIDAAFQPLSATEKQTVRQEWNVPHDTKPLVVVTGGGLGAKRINDAMVAIAASLAGKANVVHVTGKGQYRAVQKKAPDIETYQLRAFVEQGMAHLLGAADVVVTRAGATTMLELAAVGAPTVVVPNAQLTGGHQLKNAKVYEDAEAVKVVSEEALVANPRQLDRAIQEILDDPKLRERLSKNIRSFARPHAAADVVDELYEQGSGDKSNKYNK